MAVDFSSLVYLPNFDLWARSVTITPIASQPGAPAYTNRGIYSTRAVDVPSEIGAIISDQETILDIREIEYSVLPAQGDLIDIPQEGNIPAAGMFEVTDASTNGGGETTLAIRRWEAPAP
jgi:hypothetical protein